MSTELAKAYVQIMPSTKGIKGQLTNLLGGEAAAAGKSAGGLFSSSMGSALGLGGKALGGFAGMLGGVFAAGTAAIGTATAGVASLTKAAVSGYGEMEQLRGGAEKIFSGMDFSQIEKDANDAYKELGLSATQYYESVNLAGATFSQTMGAQKGYEMARRGMFAVSDYATGTGKDINELTTKFQMITRATSSYQSIADQFSGILPQTSADFLEQAQAAGYLSKSYKKLTDVPVSEYQATVTKMLEDGVNAIHLTGNTAMEAERTITGSLGMLKASWANFVTGLADPDADLDSLVDNLSDSFVAAVNNLTPAITRALPSIGKGVKQLLPIATRELPGMVRSLLPDLLDASGELVDGLGDALPDLIDVVAGEAPDVIGKISAAVEKSAPKLAKAGGRLIDALADGAKANEQQTLKLAETIFSELLQAMTTSLPMLATSGLSLAPKLLEALLSGTAENAGGISDAADDIIRALGGAVIGSLDLLKEYGPQIITEFGNGLSENADDYAAAAVRIVTGLASAVGANANVLLPAATDAVLAFVGGLVAPENIGNLLNGAEDLVDGLVDGAIASAGLMLDAAPELVDQLADGIVNNLPQAAGFIVGELVKLLGSTLTELGDMLFSGDFLLDMLTNNWIGLDIKLGKMLIDGVDGEGAGAAFINGFRKAFPDMGGSSRHGDNGGLGGSFGEAIGNNITNGAQDAFDDLVKNADVTTGHIEQAFANTLIELNTSGAEKDLDGLKERFDRIIGLQQHADQLAETLKTLNGTDTESAITEKLSMHAQNKVDSFTAGSFTASVSQARTELAGFVSESDQTIGSLETRLAAVAQQTETASQSITNTGTLIVTQLTNAQTAFVTVLEGLPERMGAMWTQTEGVFVNAPRFFETLGQNVAGDFLKEPSTLPGKMVGVWGEIKGAFSVGEAYTWGSDLVGNFMSGIDSRLGELRTKVQQMAQIVKDNVGFSEPKEGPLSDFHTYAPDMMDLFTRGITDNEAALREQIRRSFDFGEYMNQSGTVSVAGEGETGARISILERILDLLTIISEKIGRGRNGGGGLEELLDLIDEGLGQRAALQARE